MSGGGARSRALCSACPETQVENLGIGRVTGSGHFVITFLGCLVIQRGCIQSGIQSIRNVFKTVFIEYKDGVGGSREPDVFGSVFGMYSWGRRPDGYEREYM